MDRINNNMGEQEVQGNSEMVDSKMENSKGKKILKGIFKFVVIPLLCIIFIAASAFLAVFIPSHGPAVILAIGGESIPQTTSEEYSKEIATAKRELDKIDKKLAAFIPSSYYLIINSTTNRFYLYNGKELVKTDKCSTGSYIKLTNEDKKKEWIFKTPKGVFTIRNKVVDPVWTKPDWAFEEEGLPIPSARHASRYETGVLGDYAMHLGDGYMIHGTIYQRLLGMPVTHGCIRLNDKNLELIFNSLKKGSKVYIF